LLKVLFTAAVLNQGLLLLLVYGWVSVMRPVVERCYSRALSRLSVLSLVAVGVAGCGADITRFNDNPFASPLAYRGGPPEPTGSVAAPQSAPISRVESQPLEQAGPLPPPPNPSGAPAYYAPRPPDTTGALPASSSRSANRSATNWDWDGGTAVTVAPDETIEIISRRFGVPTSAIMQANNMTSPASVRPGQRLVIPRYNYDGATPATAQPAPRTRVASTTAAVPSTRRPATPAPQAAPATTAAAGEKDHVVASGQTLSSIARHYHKPRSAIAKANNLEPDVKLKIGQHLVIPGAKPAPVHVGKADPKAASQAGAPAVVGQAPAAKPLTPPANPKTAVAAPGDSARATSPSGEPTGEAAKNGAPAETNGSSPTFRWPVHGKIIAGFGPKPNGQQNDGIDLAVPEGTPVKAAEDGVVAYAGNELKGYGNLILVRHSNGFVTAYANASELMVKHGDQVKRGQVIAHSGQTGTVSSPQLHFEIRKGATPINPTQYLSSGT